MLLAGKNGNSRALRNLDTNDFAPAVGMTYVLTSDRKTVFRSGFGVSYVEPGKGGGQLYKNLPFFFSPGDRNGPERRAAPAPAARSADCRCHPTPNNIAAISAGSPNAWDFNLQADPRDAVEHRHSARTGARPLLDVSYVGTRTIGLISSNNINQTFPGPGAQGPRRPFFAVNPLVGNVTYGANYGSTRYNALQVTAEKRYSAGLTRHGRRIHGRNTWRMAETSTAVATGRRRTRVVYVATRGRCPTTGRTSS